METKQTFAITIAVLIALISLSCSAYGPVSEPRMRRGVFSKMAPSHEIKMLKQRIDRWQQQIKEHESNIERLKKLIQKTEQRIRELKKRS